MSIQLSDNIQIGQQLPVDSRYLDGYTPWADEAAVKTGIPLALRFKGLTVNIVGDEYWWRDGINDSDLELKSFDIPTPNLQDVTDGVGNNITTNNITVESIDYYSIMEPSAVGTENKNTNTYTYLGGDGVVGIKTGIHEGNIKTTDLTAGITLEFPDKVAGTYTIATTDDVPPIPSLNNVLVVDNQTLGKNIKVNNADAIELENGSLLKKGTYSFGGFGDIIVSDITNANDGYIAGIMGWGNPSGTQWSDLNGNYAKTSVAVTPSGYADGLQGMHTPEPGTFNYYLELISNPTFNGIAYFLAPGNRSGWGDPDDDATTDPPVNYWRLCVASNYPYTYFTNPSSDPYSFPTTGWVPIDNTIPDSEGGNGYDYIADYGGGFTSSISYVLNGNGGISRICSIGYEDMWQAGVRYVFGNSGTIRHATNGFTIVPDASFDYTKRFAVGSLWTLDNGDTYECTNADLNAAVWILVNTGTIPTLQQVTDVVPNGKVIQNNSGDEYIIFKNEAGTTVGIISNTNDGVAYNTGNSSYTKDYISHNNIQYFLPTTEGNNLETLAISRTVSFTAENTVKYNTNETLTVTDPSPETNKGYIVHVIGGTSTIGGIGYTTGALVYRFYNGSSWISNLINPSVDGFIPYTGATEDVDLGLFKITAAEFKRNNGQPYQFLKADGSVDDNNYLTSNNLASNIILYPTDAQASVTGYFKLVKSITDPSYNVDAVNIPTGAITTVNQLIANLASDTNILVGNPGVFNITVIGNIRKVSGSGDATFYFKAFKRNSSGTETLVATSDNTLPVSNGTYAEFSASGIWNNGEFLSTDLIVLKFYANRISGGSNPSYEFQFGGTTPIRTFVPVPVIAIPNIYLKDLADVENVAPEDKEILYWNDVDSLWEHTPLKTVAGQAILGTGNIAITTSFTTRQNANNSSNPNINYCGVALGQNTPIGNAVWTIKRLIISAAGVPVVATATGVAWTNREQPTTTYT